MYTWRISVVISFIFLSACANGNNYAPVSDINQLTQPPVKRSTKKIAAVNSINVKPNLPILTDPHDSLDNWAWPAAGKVLANFSTNNKGIDISGHIGDPIYAVAAGKIVYSGDGLPGYGNLIIIKHNSSILSTYAHNSMLIAKEGELVSKGQKIAEMGNTGTDKVMLHFEIRDKGQAIDPNVFFSRQR